MNRISYKLKLCGQSAIARAGVKNKCNPLLTHCCEREILKTTYYVNNNIFLIYERTVFFPFRRGPLFSWL